jgi:hypothetical protein
MGSENQQTKYIYSLIVTWSIQVIDGSLGVVVELPMALEVAGAIPAY